jgi:hypothetical protein
MLDDGKDLKHINFDCYTTFSEFFRILYTGSCQNPA